MAKLSKGSTRPFYGGNCASRSPLAAVPSPYIAYAGRRHLRWEVKKNFVFLWLNFSLFFGCLEWIFFVSFFQDQEPGPEWSFSFCFVFYDKEPSREWIFSFCFFQEGIQNSLQVLKKKKNGARSSKIEHTFSICQVRSVTNVSRTCGLNRLLIICIWYVKTNSYIHWIDPIPTSTSTKLVWSNWYQEYILTSAN